MGNHSVNMTNTGSMAAQSKPGMSRNGRFCVVGYGSDKCGREKRERSREFDDV